MVDHDQLLNVTDYLLGTFKKRGRWISSGVHLFFSFEPVPTKHPASWICWVVGLDAAGRVQDQKNTQSDNGALCVFREKYAKNWLTWTEKPYEQAGMIEFFMAVFAPAALQEVHGLLHDVSRRLG